MADAIGGGFKWNVDILNNIATNLLPVEKLITGAAYLIGISLAFKAIYSLKVYGEARTMMSSNGSIKEPVIYFVVAAIFIYFPTGLDIMLNSTFGNSSLLGFTTTNANQGITGLFASGSPVAWALRIIIQTIGLASFVRGWVLISRSAAQGQPPGGTGKGLIHVFGGILAINIVGTVNMINNTIYGT